MKQREVTSQTEAYSEQVDRIALDQLSQNWRSLLKRYFNRRISCADEVEDMVQEVLVRLIRRGHVSKIENLAGYVFETASSVLKDRHRRHRIRYTAAHDSFDQDMHGGVDFSPEDVLIGRERLSRAVSALLQLPERTRTIFILRRLEGMKYKEIAHRLGITVSAVEKHVQRAITHLGQLSD